MLFVPLWLRVRGKSIPSKRLVHRLIPGECVMCLVRGEGGIRAGAAAVGGPQGDKRASPSSSPAPCIWFSRNWNHPNLHLFIEHIQCARHNNPTYFTTIISSNLYDEDLMVFLFPFCVRKVSHSFLFRFQCKGRLCLKGSRRFMSPSTFCQHKASIAMNLFHFYSLMYDFSQLPIKDFRGILVLE